MNRHRMSAPMIIFALVFVVIVFQIVSDTGPSGAPVIPVWIVVVGCVSLLASILGGVFIIAYRNRRQPPPDDS